MKDPHLPPRGTKEEINDFLSAKHIAVIGLSREAKSYSRHVADQLRRREYVVTGVNPFAVDLDGIPVHADIADILPQPEAAIIILPANDSDRVVERCIKVGITKIWVRGIEQRGTVSPRLANLAREQEVTLIDGYCPIMFLDHHGFPHNLHKTIYHWFRLEPK